MRSIAAAGRVALPALLCLGIALTEGSNAGAQDAKADRKPNRLVHEKSPYLQQHAYSPVDWYPWGTEAFERAKKEDKPVFLAILQEVADAWIERRADLLDAGDRTAEILDTSDYVPSDAPLDRALLDLAFERFAGAFDSEHGGFGGAPKFPRSFVLDLLLRYAQRTGNEQALSIAKLTLRKMAEGGMYDQIGGGFHRYSTDAQWRVPHFEKMLYDHALLARTYIAAWKVTGDDSQAGIARECLDKSHKDGRLLRRCMEGEARFLGCPEDYSYLCEGLLDLYQATFEERWLDEAVRLARGMVRLFWIEEEGGFYDTGADGEALLTRPRDLGDGAAPSGNSIAVCVLERLALVTGDPSLREKAEGTIRRYLHYLAKVPTTYPQMLQGLEDLVTPRKQVVLAARPDDPALAPMLRVVRRAFLPDAVVMLHTGGDAGERLAARAVPPPTASARSSARGRRASPPSRRPKSSKRP